MNNIEYDKVFLLDGFWKDRFNLNANVSIPHILEVFKDTRLKALDFEKDENNIPHIFYDSDTVKTLEAVAYTLFYEREKHQDLEKYSDELIHKFAIHQDKNGYVNSHFQVVEPENELKDRRLHELYCLGHMIEAAIAYHQATGKDEFLNVVKKYCDYVELRFMKKKDTPYLTPGHEEIELALLKLYIYTNDKKYLRMAGFFLENRGNNTVDIFEVHANNRYAQDNAPIRELKEAEGHAVRAMYLYDAMAKYAKIKKDKELVETLKVLFASVKKKQYITGGIGSSFIGESFSKDYVLPNLQAYSESCAAIGEMMFLLDLFNLTKDKDCHDNIERILYNGFLSSTSLDGKCFFYENPLEIDYYLLDKDTCAKEEYKTRYPITQRVELFGCSCCPPNIARFVASISRYIYASEKDNIYINQFISSKTEIDGTKIELLSNYPKEFSFKLNVKTNKNKVFYIRKPNYVENKNVVVDANGCEFIGIKKGYIVLLADKDFSVNIKFITKPVFIESNPQIVENNGKVCLMNGPIVYCLEGLDNVENLHSLFVNRKSNLSLTYNEKYGMNTISCEGVKKLSDNTTYSLKYKTIKTKIVFMPYYCFTNREKTNMLVWINAL